MTYQTTFAHTEFADKKKITRREKFLARMEEVIPSGACAEVTDVDAADISAEVSAHYPGRSLAVR
jgi:hypothetical protein